MRQTVAFGSNEDRSKPKPAENSCANVRGQSEGSASPSHARVRGSESSATSPTSVARATRLVHWISMFRLYHGGTLQRRLGDLTVLKKSPELFV